MARLGVAVGAGQPAHAAPRELGDQLHRLRLRHLLAGGEPVARGDLGHADDPGGQQERLVIGEVGVMADQLKLEKQLGRRPDGESLVRTKDEYRGIEVYDKNEA